MSDLTEQAHLAAPCDMPAEYIAQLTHELYTRTFMYPDSKSLHDRAMEIKSEVTKRLQERDQLRAEVDALRKDRDGWHNAVKSFDRMLCAYAEDGVIELRRTHSETVHALVQDLVSKRAEFERLREDLQAARKAMELGVEGLKGLSWLRSSHTHLWNNAATRGLAALNAELEKSK